MTRACARGVVAEGDTVTLARGVALMGCGLAVLAACAPAAQRDDVGEYGVPSESAAATDPRTVDGAPPAVDVDRAVPPERATAMNDDGTAGSGCTPGGGDLPDGVWYGQVREWDGRAARFDLMCVFHPDSERGGGRPADAPVGGYATANDNDALRTVPVAQAAHFYPPDFAWYPDLEPTTFDKAIAVWGTGEYWIYINGGQITAAVAAHE